MRQYNADNPPHDPIMERGMQDVSYYRGLLDKGAAITNAQMDKCRRILVLVERRIVWIRLMREYHDKHRDDPVEIDTTIPSEHAHFTYEQQNTESVYIDRSSRASPECTKNKSSTTNTDTTDEGSEAPHHPNIIDVRTILTDTHNPEAASETGPSEHRQSVELVAADGNESDETYNEDDDDEILDESEMGTDEEMGYRPRLAYSAREWSLGTVPEESDEE